MRVDDEAMWDLAEATLEDALKATGLPYEVLPGEGAFYGPKLEFHLTDAIGRTWQCGTFQLDPFMPGRLGASYVGEDGEKHPPLMLHRAILGTFERFLGIMIENYAGRFPLWLAPVQAVVATIVSDADAYGGEVEAALRAAGLRVESDLRNEKINYKVREHSLAKIPYLLVVGKREAEQRNVAVRPLGTEARQEVLGLDALVARLGEEARPPDLRD
jgi:threonyl-tRNA synthetase